MKSRTENGAGSNGASPLIVVRLLDQLPLLYQILDLTAEISLRLGQRVPRIGAAMSAGDKAAVATWYSSG
jgi:hypothetical protein